MEASNPSLIRKSKTRCACHAAFAVGPALPDTAPDTMLYAASAAVSSLRNPPLLTKGTSHEAHQPRPVLRRAATAASVADQRLSEMSDDRSWADKSFWECSWKERCYQAGIWLVLLGATGVGLVFILLLFGQAVDVATQRSIEHDRCLKRATNGYEIQQCR